MPRRLTLHALLTAPAARRLSRGHRSGGQLSSSELAGPPTAVARLLCACCSTSLSCRNSQSYEDSAMQRHSAAVPSL